MKPSKMRNKQIWQATHNVRSRQLGAALSSDLRQKHSRRSVRVVMGDTVKVVRGEYKDVEGKVSSVFAIGGRIAIEGVKKEKGKGEKFDVEIHSSNVVVTTLNSDDSRRMKRIRGESTRGHSGSSEAAGHSAKGTADSAAKGTADSAAKGEKVEAAASDVAPAPKKADAAKAGANKAAKRTTEASA